MDNIEALAKKIMALFRNNHCRVGDIILPQWYMRFFSGLDTREQDLAPRAINWLEERERSYITVENESSYPNITLKLTQSGYDHIYGNADETGNEN
jgi:hypothetical protein